MELLAIPSLPPQPLAAAAAFHASWLARAEEILHTGADLLIVFGPADHTHKAWRAAAVAGLARAHVPFRVNAVASADAAAIAAAATYFAAAPGVTGQTFALVGGDAGIVA